MSAAGTLTVIIVAVMEAGVSTGLLPNVTVAPGAKFLPLMVKRNAGPRAVVVFGERVVIAGTGLLFVSAKLAAAATPGAVAATL